LTFLRFYKLTSRICQKFFKRKRKKRKSSTLVEGKCDAIFFQKNFGAKFIMTQNFFEKPLWLDIASHFPELNFAFFFLWLSGVDYVTKKTLIHMGYIFMIALQVVLKHPFGFAGTYNFDYLTCCRRIGTILIY